MDFFRPCVNSIFSLPVRTFVFRIRFNYLRPRGSFVINQLAFNKQIATSELKTRNKPVKKLIKKEKQEKIGKIKKKERKNEQRNCGGAEQVAVRLRARCINCVYYARVGVQRACTSSGTNAAVLLCTRRQRSRYSSPIVMLNNVARGSRATVLQSDGGFVFVVGRWTSMNN